MTDQKPNRFSRKVGQIGLAIVAALAVVVALASPAYANFPHFKSVSVGLVTGTSLASARSATSTTSASAQLPDLQFTWTEVGVGSTNVDYSLSTVVVATFGCMNGGGKHPSASNKTTITTPVQTSVKLTADQNGKITGSAILDTASVSTGGFSCPSGQTLVALSASFTHNTITDTTNGVTATDEDISVPLGP